MRFLFDFAQSSRSFKKLRSSRERNRQSTIDLTNTNNARFARVLKVEALDAHHVRRQVRSARHSQ